MCRNDQDPAIAHCAATKNRRTCSRSCSHRCAPSAPIFNQPRPQPNLYCAPSAHLMCDLRRTGPPSLLNAPPTAPGESFAAPDPEFDLASGVVVPIPATRGRRRTATTTTPSQGAALDGGAGPGDRLRQQGGGEWPRESATTTGGGEAFPSLPAAPPQTGRGATQERHAFSLVGKTLRPSRAAAAGGAGSAAGDGGEGGAVGGSGEEVGLECWCWCPHLFPSVSVYSFASFFL